jgi:hypothetical protein
MPLSWRLEPDEDAIAPLAMAVELFPDAMAVVDPEAIFFVDCVVGAVESAGADPLAAFCVD